MNQFFVIQIGYEIFGCGSTEREAYDEAASNVDPDADFPAFESISRYVGTARTADGGPRRSSGRKSMTQNGEMHTGEMVLMSREAAAAQGFNVAYYDE